MISLDQLLKDKEEQDKKENLKTNSINIYLAVHEVLSKEFPEFPESTKKQMIPRMHIQQVI